jgi:hypothetical protein
VVACSDNRGRLRTARVRQIEPTYRQVSDDFPSLVGFSLRELFAALAGQCAQFGNLRKKRELANGKADSLLYLLVIQVRGSFDVDG